MGPIRCTGDSVFTEDACLEPDYPTNEDHSANDGQAAIQLDKPGRKFHQALKYGAGQGGEGQYQEKYVFFHVQACQE
jgi:hypothetical protein